MNQKPVLFSQFLNSSELMEVNFNTYFPVLNSGKSIRLLPSDHAKYYPLEFDSESRKIVKGTLNFFNSVFYNAFPAATSVAEEKVKWSPQIKPDQKQALFVVLLDNCYGHSFLKMLNLFEIYNHYCKSHDIWVITPPNISHFIPDDKFRKIEVSIGFNEAQKCASLGPIIAKLRSLYTIVDFPCLNTYPSFTDKEGICGFFNFLPEKKVAPQKRVTFYYRSDFFRTWAGKKQGKNIAEFFSLLRDYFGKEVVFTVVGDKDSFVFPSGIEDRRINDFGKEVDLAYNQIFSESIITIGLIGSNMLQPSMFSKSTVHLVPYQKISIIADELFNYKNFAIPAWFENIYIDAGVQLMDLKPKILMEKVVVMYWSNIIKEYKFKCLEAEGFFETESLADYIETNFPFFKFNEAGKLKERITDESNKKMFLRLKINRLLGRK